ncbi:uncharacterized protein B0I36DRAFT_416345 [Microdochium trichocladiopsis]|uniref:Rhodopsin domain-containing protein n=1 Tax=Microdochium trichocladiopsis TaxID=1682393 RepID=A0A9P9BLC2_9PEZI|nr:uncharacterized protein B0I36DRAFT_416345 [Microdochium trichocladiopsis]KAH7024744.1 hypothetical protein B0I36DRAFT_416345 [Microdochium trichocladiopsis]
MDRRQAPPLPPTPPGTWVFDPTAPNRGPEVNTAVWTLFGFSTLFLILRVYCKIRKLRRLWWDDYVLLAAWLCFTISCIQLSINISRGFGRPGANIDPANAYDVGFGGLIVGAFIILAAVWSKTSFALTLMRIAGPKLKIVLWVIIALMNIFQFAAVIIQWTQCTPLEKVWNRRLPGGTCWPVPVSVGVSMFAAAFSGVSDIILAGLPWVILVKLQMKTKEKIGIAVAMSMGIIAGVTAFMKCVKIPILGSQDFTLHGGELTIWASAEIATTIMAASIPVLRTLLRDVKSSSSGNSPLRERTTTSPYQLATSAPALPATPTTTTTSASSTTMRTTLTTAATRESWQAPPQRVPVL